MIKEEYRVEHHVLRNYFKKLNILFIESLKIDKEIFSFSIRKWIPVPFIHRQVDYQGLQDRGQQILEALIDIEEDLSQLVFEKASINDLVNKMLGYTQLSIRAQEALNTLSSRLCLKADGIKNITHKEYENLCKKYFSLDHKRDRQYSLQMDLIAQQLGFDVLQKEI